MTGRVGGEHSMNFMAGWQPQEIARGNNTPNSTRGLSRLLQPATVHGGPVQACFAQRWEGDTCPREWERDPLLQHESRSHWQILRGTHHFPLQDSDYRRLQAPSAVPRISQQRIWCKLALAISAGKGEIKQHTHFFMTHKGCSSKAWWESRACFRDGCRVSQVQGEP